MFVLIAKGKIILYIRDGDGKYVINCKREINQCDKCNHWGHIEKYCKTPVNKYVKKNELPNPNTKKMEADSEQSGGLLRKKLIK